jgi:hypothetical protein
MADSYHALSSDWYRSPAYWKASRHRHLGPDYAAVIVEGAELNRQPLALLEPEIARGHRQQVRCALTADHRGDDGACSAEGAALVQKREAAYQRVFDAIVAEEGVLCDLYSPLMARLKAAGGTMKNTQACVFRGPSPLAGAPPVPEPRRFRTSAPAAAPEHRRSHPPNRTSAV